MSFRSGLAVFAAVLALTATGIVLTVTMGGGHQAAATPPAVSASAAPDPAAGQSSDAAEPSPSAGPTATQTSPESQPIADDTPGPGTSTTPAATSAAPSSLWPTYRPMGLAPSHSLKSPGGPGVNPPPGWIPG
jgi:predicted lipid-binding transport protein (Tim44 family)